MKYLDFTAIQSLINIFLKVYVNKIYTNSSLLSMKENSTFSEEYKVEKKLFWKNKYYAFLVKLDYLKDVCIETPFQSVMNL